MLRCPSTGSHHERIRARWKSTGKYVVVPQRSVWKTKVAVISDRAVPIASVTIWGNITASRMRSWSRAAWRTVCWWIGRTRSRCDALATIQIRAKAGFRETLSLRVGPRYHVPAPSASNGSLCAPTATRQTFHAPTPHRMSASTRTSRSRWQAQVRTIMYPCRPPNRFPYAISILFRLRCRIWTRANVFPRLHPRSAIPTCSPHVIPISPHEIRPILERNRKKSAFPMTPWRNYCHHRHLLARDTLLHGRFLWRTILCTRPAVPRLSVEDDEKAAMYQVSSVFWFIFGLLKE